MTCRNDLTCADSTDTIAFNLNINNNVITKEYDYSTVGDLQRWVPKYLVFEIHEETDIKVIILTKSSFKTGRKFLIIKYLNVLGT
jgi:hypothetical protein